MKRVAAALVAVVGLSACAGHASAHSVSRADPDLRLPPPSTTVTSQRLIPARRSVPLPAAVTAALDAALVNTNSCLVVEDGKTGGLLYNHNGGVPLTPASTQKLLVAAAALEELGPNYRFVTRVVARRSPQAGELDDAWLVGGGDPLLASPSYAAYLASRPETAGYPTTSFTALASQLVRRGVRLVRGGIHGDASRYDDAAYLPSWTPHLNQGEFDIGPLSALEADQGLDRWRPDVPTADPTGHAAGVLAALLRGQGVGALQGSDQRAPANAVVLAQVTSAPLSAIVTAMLAASDNQIAELLVRELDHHAGGTGTTAGGVRVVTSTIARLAVPTAGLALVDGSGLSHADRVSCDTLLDVLGLAGLPNLAVLATGLPVAGVSGTLYNVFRGTPAAGRLSAKGGYLDGVAALAGRLSGPRRLRFAFEVNGVVPYAVGIALEGRIADALASAS